MNLIITRAIAGPTPELSSLGHEDALSSLHDGLQSQYCNRSSTMWILPCQHSRAMLGHDTVVADSLKLSQVMGNGDEDRSEGRAVNMMVGSDLLECDPEAISKLAKAANQFLARQKKRFGPLELEIRQRQVVHDYNRRVSQEGKDREGSKAEDKAE